MLRKWENLPSSMQNDEVKFYYNILQHKRISIVVKYIFDKLMAITLLLIFSPLFLILGILIKIDSPGEIFFRQVRVTQYGKSFRIYKFRTMVSNAEKIGNQVTINQDIRITKIGKKIRKCRLDELPQLINIIKGEMSFVGTRPEVPKYVAFYSKEMLATLLLPAGVTSSASIAFKDEEQLLKNEKDIDIAYVEKVLPQKMEYNLEGLRNFSFSEDIKIMLKTVRAVL